jgi:hypothetical protein
LSGWVRLGTAEVPADPKYGEPHLLTGIAARG